MSPEMLDAILEGDNLQFDSLAHGAASPEDRTEKEMWNYLHQALMVPYNLPSPEMIQRVVDWGVDVNAVDMYGNTPLHYAVRSAASQIVRVLLGAGADVNVVNNKGVSPLRQALLKKPYSFDSIRLLLQSGASVNRSINGGLTDFQYAEEVASDNPAILDLFRVSQSSSN